VVHEPVVFAPLIHDVNSWLNSDFERTALANFWNDDEKLERVKAYLNVKVLDELMTSNLLIQIKWKHFSDWFINKYSDTTFNIKKNFEFQNRKQKSNETCYQYLEDKCLLGQQAGIYIPENQFSSMILAGLRKEEKDIVVHKLGISPTLHDLKNCLHEFEQNRIFIQNTSEELNKTRMTTFISTNNQFDTNEQNHKNNFSHIKQNNFVCYSCGELGHRSSNCAKTKTKAKTDGKETPAAVMTTSTKQKRLN